VEQNASEKEQKGKGHINNDGGTATHHDKPEKEDESG